MRSYNVRSTPTVQLPRFAWEESEVLPRIAPVDTRRCITGTGNLPFRFICNLVVNGGSCCTGTLIGPRTVLTAGHCLLGDLDPTWPQCLRPGLPPSAMRAFPGRNGTAAAPLNAPFSSSPVAALVLAEGFTNSKAQTGTPLDYSVAILQDQIGNTSGWWTFDRFAIPGDPLGSSIVSDDSLLPLPNASIPLSIAGYPSDRPAPQHLGGASDPCFSPSVPRGSVLYRDVNGLAALGGGMLEYFNDTTGGMSGSPVWMESPATGRMLLAVHVSRNIPPDPPEANRGVLITGTVREFVRAHSFSPPGSTPPPRPTVRLKSKGVTVRELQYRLNIWIFTAPGTVPPPLKVDGDFGPKTLSATRAFQRAMGGLTVDGVVGPLTWRRLQLPF